MIKVNNHSWNWCNYLVKEKGMKPNMYDLQKFVGKTNTENVPAEYRMNVNDDWYFENKMTNIKLTSCKNYCMMHKATRNRMKKQNVELKDKSLSTLEGSFQIPHKYIRLLTERDSEDVAFQKKHIAIMKYNFLIPNQRTPKNEKFIKLSKNVDRLPPIEHDVRITKRANGKFVLQIPCDSKYTRQHSTPKDAMCGVDPGGRTFATVYDPTECIAYQVGTVEDKKRVIRKLHDRIDKTHAHLQRAIERNHEKAKEERTAQLKKLHLKLKTFVNDIHLKLSSHLVKNYSYVALGKIGVSSIVRKDRPNHLAKRANRDLLCWSHFRFRQRLLHRANGTSCNIVVQDEAYTSKTCGICGTKNNTLGSSETFKCEKCIFETHRDVNGARNILLKSLKQFPFE
jgi:transposase